MTPSRTPRVHSYMRSIQACPLGPTTEAWPDHQVCIDGAMHLNPHFRILFNFSFDVKLQQEEYDRI